MYFLFLPTWPLQAIQNTPVPMPDHRPPSQGVVGGHVPPSGVVAPPVPSIAPQPVVVPLPVTPVAAATVVEAKQPPTEEAPNVPPAADAAPEGQKKRKKMRRKVGIGTSWQVS